MSKGLELEAEARQIVDSTRNASLPLRLMGGLAVRLRVYEVGRPTRRQEYTDLDFVGYGKHSAKLIRHLESIGCAPDARFNALFGANRLRFANEDTGTNFDVVLDQFAMCHRLPLAGRLELDRYTLPLADLLLTKLQVVQLTEKDVQDIYSLMLAFPLSPAPAANTIDLARITEICGDDWGWWRTVTGTLETVRQLANEDLPHDECQLLAERIEQMKATLDSAPKSLAWKMRAAIGDRVQWYELPDDAPDDRPV